MRQRLSQGGRRQFFRVGYPMKESTYLSVLTVALFALVTLAATDLGLGHLVPGIHRRELQDGIDDLEQSDPETLVLGSSHARTFHVLGQELATARVERCDGGPRLWKRESWRPTPGSWIKELYP